MTRDETLMILVVLRSIWPESKVDDATITGWHWAFEETPYPLVMTAAKQYIRAGKPFHPKPADLLELIGGAAVTLVPEMAWSEVQAEVRRVGYNRLPVWRNGEPQPAPQRSFSHPLIAQAVDAIGWADICTSDKPEILRAQFTKTLTTLRDRAVKEVQQRGVPLPAGAPHAALTTGDE